MTRHQIKEIALREIRTRGRTRGYRIITAIMLLVAVAAPIVISLLPGPSDDLQEVTIGIGAGAQPGLTESLEALAEDVFDLSIVNVEDNAVEAIDELLDSGDVDVVIEPPAGLAWHETESPEIRGLVTAAFQQLAALDRANELGLDPGVLAEVFEPVEVTERLAVGSETTEDVRRGVAFFGLFLAFLLPQIFGQLTMLSVVEEKSTRVVEVLLSQIRPGTLLAGKIIGLCALAIVQLLVIVLGLIGSLLATNTIEIPSSVWQFVPIMTLSILGGLLIYTTLFALLGSLISRQEDAAQVMMPVFVPLMAGYFVGQAAVFGNAESLLVRVLTWFPLTSPMLLPVRAARGAIGPIETAVSLGLLALGAFLFYRLAARVYEFTLLRTGSRVGWGELVRLSRGALID